jgi:hypothetical protein
MDLRMYVMNTAEGLVILTAVDDVAAIGRAGVGARILYRSEPGSMSPTLMGRSASGIW